MLPTPSRVFLAKSRRIFNCHCRVKIREGPDESLLDHCLDILQDIDIRYNSHQPGSHFHRINRHAGSWVEVDEECLTMIRTLGRISALTSGAYDITCMPLIRLWGFYRREQQRIPTPMEILETLEHVDFRAIAIDGHRVKIRPGQEIITGSFLKAFAVDRAADFLRSRGVTDAIINAGGSTILAINDAEHPAWTVNVPHPTTPDSIARKLPLSNRSFSLSARSNNFITIAGRKHGHILDSRTGRPSTTLQVGVTSGEAFIGDTISTALFTLADDELEDTARALAQHFDFEYFRVGEHGGQPTGTCS